MKTARDLSADFSSDVTPAVERDPRAASGTPHLSRRRFLSRAGGGALALLLTGSQVSSALASTGGGDVETEGWGLLVDLTRCTGCESCVLACKAANGRATPDAAPEALSCDAYSFLDQHALLDADGVLRSQSVKRQCMHCLHPACASACTVGALKRQSNGPVTYNADLCIGCRYCQYACPFGVPTYDWDNPVGLIHKCEMCADRLAEGQLPACVSACPNGAIRFGPRHALLAQAHAQIESNPYRYVDHVYGEHEAGGTSVLYLSAVPFDQLGFPILDGKIIAEDAETIMMRTPWVAVGVAALATSLHLLSKRHHQLAAGHAAAQGSASSQRGEDASAAPVVNSTDAPRNEGV
jgi:formate dehydrogenase iron-sulfur subunit